VFKNSNLFGVITEKKESQIKRIMLDRKTQKLVNAHFKKIIDEQQILKKERVNFDGRYTPEFTEALSISSYSLNSDITTAVRAPIGEDVVNQVDIDIPNLKYVFLGEEIDGNFIIAFQLIQKSQHLSSEGIKLLQRKGTFESVGESGFTLSDRVEVVFQNGDLIFESFHLAKRVFHLQEYYREATNQELTDFVASESVETENREIFDRNADSWVRRKIALIRDSGVLETNSVSRIYKKARECGVEIATTQNGGARKIVLPDDKKKLKEVLKFLDEDIYTGPLTNQVFETNSKLSKE
jgi:hypothetical protein